MVSSVKYSDTWKKAWDSSASAKVQAHSWLIDSWSHLTGLYSLITHAYLVPWFLIGLICHLIASINVEFIQNNDWKKSFLATLYQTSSTLNTLHITGSYSKSIVWSSSFIQVSTRWRSTTKQVSHKCASWSWTARVVNSSSSSNVKARHSSTRQLVHPT